MMEPSHRFGEGRMNEEDEQRRWERLDFKVQQLNIDIGVAADRVEHMIKRVERLRAELEKEDGEQQIEHQQEGSRNPRGV